MSLVVCHTADWHLGRTLHGASFDRAHRAFLGWLADLLVTREVDVLVVAGDVFDRSVPTASAEEAFYAFLAGVRARAPGLSVVIVAGNHDGPARLAAPAPVLARMGVTVVGSAPLVTGGDPDRPAALDPGGLVVPLRARGGSLVGHLVAMPFLRPSDLSLVSEPRVGDATLAGEPSAGREAHAAHTEGVGDPISRVRALYARAVRIAEARNAEHGGQLVLATGHGQVRGASLSPDSERPLFGGDEASLPLDVFPERVAYVALGHLHLAQALGGGRVRYAGAPLPLAFSERAYPHEVVLARFEGAARVATESIRVPSFVRLVRLEGAEGQALELEAAMEALRGLVSTGYGGDGRGGGFGGDDAGETWVQARVRLDAPRPALKRELAACLTDARVRLVHLELERPGGALTARRDAIPWPALSPRAVLERAWAGVSTEPLPLALAAALERAWDDTRAAREEECPEP